MTAVVPKLNVKITYFGMKILQSLHSHYSNQACAAFTFTILANLFILTNTSRTDNTHPKTCTKTLHDSIFMQIKPPSCNFEVEPDHIWPQTAAAPKKAKQTRNI